MIAAISVAILISAFVLIAIANSYAYEVLGEVNGKSPPEKQISRLFVNMRFFDVLQRHRELYPSSLKRKRLNQYAFTGFALLLILVAINLVHI
jgi:hypothetical protein